MESNATCTNLFTGAEEPLKRYYKGIRAVNYTKTLIHFPEVESIFLAMFGNLIDGSLNAVWRLALEHITPEFSPS